MASPTQPTILCFEPSIKASARIPGGANILPISMTTNLRQMWFSLAARGGSEMKVTTTVVKSPCSSLIALGPNIVACHIADDLYPYLVMEAEDTSPAHSPRLGTIHRMEDHV